MTDLAHRIPGQPTNGRLLGTSHYGWLVWVNVTCVECPGCGFTMDFDHVDASREGYTCPNCGCESTEDK